MAMKGKAIAKGVVNSLFRRLRKGNIVVFHIGRCGSTVLANLLNQHPNIYWDGEIYFRHTNIDKDISSNPGLVFTEGERILRSQMPRAGMRFYGIEVQLHQLIPFEIILPKYLQLLKRYGFTHFVVLNRRNYLRKALSSLIALSTGRYDQSIHEKSTCNRVYVNMDNIEIKYDKKPLFSFFDEWDHQYSILDGTLENHQNVLHLTYEDDIMADPYKGYRLFCEFLDLKPHDKVSVLDSRANPFTLQEMIINYDEVK